MPTLNVMLQGIPPTNWHDALIALAILIAF